MSHVRVCKSAFASAVMLQQCIKLLQIWHRYAMSMLTFAVGFLKLHEARRISSPFYIRETSKFPVAEAVSAGNANTCAGLCNGLIFRLKSTQRGMEDTGLQGLLAPLLSRISLLCQLQAEQLCHLHDILHS